MRQTTSIAALGLTLAATLSLTACIANPLDSLVEDVVSGGVENFVEDQLGEGVDINVPGSDGGATLPSSWPTDVPTPDGEVIFSLAAGGTFTATILVSDQSAVDSLYSELEAAGYELSSEADFGGLISRTYDGPTYAVSIGSIPDETTGDISVQLGITEKTP